MPDDTGLSLKLAVLDDRSRVLLVRADGSSRLPEVTIPLYTRLAYEATRAAEQKYGLSLFTINTISSRERAVGSTEAEQLVVICRLQNPTTTMQDGLMWSESGWPDITPDDRAALDAALKEFTDYNSGAKVSSFGRYRSLDILREWYTPHLDALHLRETSLQQWNGDPWFALVRIGVESLGEPTPQTPKALWFKAVGEPNTREYAVTKALTEECPYWFAKIVGTHPEWHGWLMEEVDGHELDDERDGRPWALTARILAKVQKRFVGREEELLSLGCRDWRMPRVLEALDPFFDEMEEIMRRQTKGHPRPLDASELRQLKTRCRELCHRVEDVDIPYTIAHGDFSPHNVIVSNGWPFLIDWAEAYLTFPFVSWEYFWNRMIKDHPEQAEWHSRMLRNYAYRVWASQLGASRVDEGLRLSPAMAVLIHALYSVGDPARQPNPGSDRAKRSLVRRLHREIEILEPVGAL